MRLDLVAAWVLSLPIAAASPVASVPSVAVEHTANPAGDCLPGWRTSTVPLLPESRGLDPTTKRVPLNRSTKDFVVQVGEDALVRDGHVVRQESLELQAPSFTSSRADL